MGMTKNLTEPNEEPIQAEAEAAYGYCPVELQLRGGRVEYPES